MLPYMQQKDIDALDKLFEQCKPKIVFEWGCGGSTVYFPKKHDCVQKWISIEHDPIWIDKIRIEINQKVMLFEVARHEIIYEMPYGLQSVYTADFIIVDGIKRKECLEFSEDICKKDALVFLHDSGRTAYHAWLDIFPHYKKLTDGRVPDDKGGFKRDGLHVLSKSKITV